MAEHVTERIFNGTPVSGDIAIGPLVVLRQRQQTQRQPGIPAEERDLLNQALVTAKRGLEKLISRQSSLAGEILEFQVALIEDDDLIDPVYQRIDKGEPAHVAWSQALESEIAEYRSGGDEYLAARADDLADLKQRVLTAIHEDDSAVNYTADGAILVAENLTPSVFLEQDWQRLAGAVLLGGSPTSHVAILARARNIPLIAGLKADLDDLPDGCSAILNSPSGTLIIHPAPETFEAAKAEEAKARDTLARAERHMEDAASTANDEAVKLYLNVDDPAVLKSLSPKICDGIGLTRTEFLFAGGYLPGEDEQFEIYREIVTWAQGRPVTLRTLDAGGDKPIKDVTIEGESNPFLGVRGVRLSILNTDLFSTQLRAMVRAAAFGQVKILVPMLTLPDELDQVRDLLNQVVASLGVKDAPELGMMVEVPAAALTAASFNADFYSIGSNDLIQYTNAVARDNPSLSYLVDPPGPAVFELIERTVSAAASRNVEVSLCGDMASMAQHIGKLLDSGLRTLSVAAGQIGRVKQAIRCYDTALRNENGRL